MQPIFVLLIDNFGFVSIQGLVSVGRLSRASVDLPAFSMESGSSSRNSSASVALNAAGPAINRMRIEITGSVHEGALSNVR